MKQDLYRPLVLRGSPYPEPQKRYFFLIFFKQKIKTQVKVFRHIFRYISEFVKIVFLFENDKKSRSNRRFRAASRYGQLKKKTFKKDLSQKWFS